MNDTADLVGVLRAAGETTRLRLLALLADGEQSVKDLTEILGQSQPRVSRHLKLLADAGLITRNAEGAWAYYGLAPDGPGGDLARWLIGRLSADDADAAARPAAARGGAAQPGRAGRGLFRQGCRQLGSAALATRARRGG